MECAPASGDAPASLLKKTPTESRKPREGARRENPERGKGIELVASEEFDLDSPELYLNRELTWLAFTRRVLNEARDPRVPLLERVKFLSIVGSNLDEFSMKRIGGLKQQVGAGVHELTVDGRTPQEQIAECNGYVCSLCDEMRETYNDLLEQLRDNDILITPYRDLSETEQAEVREHYRKNIFPLVTPLAMDPSHPFPFISNLSLNLLVALRAGEGERELLARVKVPVGAGVPRFIRVGRGHRYVSLEDVMACNLDLLFPGVEAEACAFFRVTRNANTERDEETADDLLAMIEAELRDRKFAPIVRLETAAGIRAAHRGMLAAELGLDEAVDIFESDMLLGVRDLMEIAVIDKPELHDPDHHPAGNSKLQDSRKIFHVIRDKREILLEHPYESFSTSVERFVREASEDPKVRAIKMTLYRTSADTRIIEHLVDAARNGKQVAVVMELKARFDEEANIRWASRLEEVGIHVNYGVVGLKTHAKVIQVLRMDYDGLRRYVHIGTGNYHAGTARLYADFGLFTCDEQIGEDVTELFNYLTTGLKPSRTYRKLLTAPKQMKKAILARIEREIEKHSEEDPGLIRFKCNALEDATITKALYRASQAGVRVELIIRDTCRLIPGIPGLSSTVSVISVVGRFLEHGRLYYFRNGGGDDEEFYVGSADLMKRNLDSRVEVLAPVESEELRDQLRTMLDTQMQDTRSVWEMRADGSYFQRDSGEEGDGCQQKLIKNAERRYFEATRLRKRKTQSIARRVSVDT